MDIWKMVVVKVQMLYVYRDSSYLTLYFMKNTPKPAPWCVFVLWLAHACILLSLHLLATNEIFCVDLNFSLLNAKCTNDGVSSQLFCKQ